MSAQGFKPTTFWQGGDSSNSCTNIYYKKDCIQIWTLLMESLSLCLFFYIEVGVLLYKNMKKNISTSAHNVKE